MTLDKAKAKHIYSTGVTYDCQNIFIVQATYQNIQIIGTVNLLEMSLAKLKCPRLHVADKNLNSAEFASRDRIVVNLSIHHSLFQTRMHV